METALLVLFIGALLLAFAGWLAFGWERAERRALERRLDELRDEAGYAEEVYEQAWCEACGADLRWRDCFVCAGSRQVNHGGLNGSAAVAPCTECEGEGGWPYCPSADCVNHQRWEVPADE